jgi:hypothetical protein
MSSEISSELACKMIEDHINLYGYEGLSSPVPLELDVEVYINGAAVGMQAIGRALPLLVAIFKGAQMGTLTRVLRQNPFDLGQFFSEHAMNDDFSFCPSTGERLKVKDLYSRILQAFAFVDPEHLRQSAHSILAVEPYAVFAAMETGLPEIELRALIKADRAIYEDDSGVKNPFPMEIALSESPYFLFEDGIFPNQSAVEFLRKSGALDGDYLNGKYTIPYFWENILRGAYAQTDRCMGCRTILNTAFETMEKTEPGLTHRVLRSLDFSRLEDAHLDQNLVRGIFRLARAAQDFDSMLLKLGLLQTATLQDFSSEKLALSSILTTQVLDAALGQMDVFIQNAELVVQQFFVEIISLPDDTHIGLNAFTCLSLLSNLQLPEQIWDIDTAVSAMNRLLPALAQFHTELDDSRSVQVYKSRQAIKGLRQFNNTFLKHWGLDASIFVNVSQKSQEVLALSDFDLKSLENVSEGTLRKRMEMDLGL